MSACFLRSHVCDVIKFRDDHARMRNNDPLASFAREKNRVNLVCPAHLNVIFYFRSVSSCSASSSNDCTKLVGESHPDSYLGFCVCSTSNTKDCKYMCGNTIPCFAPLDDRGDRTISFIDWNPCIPRTFLFSSREK